MMREGVRCHVYPNAQLKCEEKPCINSASVLEFELFPIRSKDGAIPPSEHKRLKKAFLARLMNIASSKLFTGMENNKMVYCQGLN